MSTNCRWYTSRFYLHNDDGGLPPYTRWTVESYPEKWKYGIPKGDQPKLQPLLRGWRGYTVVASRPLWLWRPSTTEGCYR